MFRNKRKALRKHRSANVLQKSYNKNMKPNGDRRTLRYYERQIGQKGRVIGPRDRQILHLRWCTLR